MPMSLWLIPHQGNPFTKSMQELISDEIPRIFVSQDQIKKFIPHVTLTSDVDVDKVAGGKSPQEWLDSLEVPEFRVEKNEVVVMLDTVEAEDPEFRKLNIAVNGDPNLQKLASYIRRQALSVSEDEAESWAKKEYAPHFSLMYADVPTDEVKNRKALVEMKIQFSIGDIFACCGGTLCMGGYMVLVDTSQPVDKWEPVAKRETPWVMWRATRNLI